MGHRRERVRKNDARRRAETGGVLFGMADVGKVAFSRTHPKRKETTRPEEKRIGTRNKE